MCAPEAKELELLCMDSVGKSCNVHEHLYRPHTSGENSLPTYVQFCRTQLMPVGGAFELLHGGKELSRLHNIRLQFTAASHELSPEISKILQRQDCVGVKTSQTVRLSTQVVEALTDVGVLWELRGPQLFTTNGT